MEYPRYACHIRWAHHHTIDLRLFLTIYCQFCGQVALQKGFVLSSILRRMYQRSISNADVWRRWALITTNIMELGRHCIANCNSFWRSTDPEEDTRRARTRPGKGNSTASTRPAKGHSPGRNTPHQRIFSERAQTGTQDSFIRRPERSAPEPSSIQIESVAVCIPAPRLSTFPRIFGMPKTMPVTAMEKIVGRCWLRCVFDRRCEQHRRVNGARLDRK